jgi:hypothetical protein
MVLEILSWIGTGNLDPRKIMLVDATKLRVCSVTCATSHLTLTQSRTFSGVARLVSLANRRRGASGDRPPAVCQESTWHCQEPAHGVGPTLFMGLLVLAFRDQEEPKREMPLTDFVLIVQVFALGRT